MYFLVQVPSSILSARRLSVMERCMENCFGCKETKKRRNLQKVSPFFEDNVFFLLQMLLFHQFQRAFLARFALHAEYIDTFGQVGLGER